MIGPLLAAMNVSPSHARPRMPMTAVIPAWQVLVVTIFPTGAPQNTIINAASESMTIAIVIGMLTTVAAGAGAVPGGGAGAGAGIRGAVVGAPRPTTSGSFGTAGAVDAVFAGSGSF